MLAPDPDTVNTFERSLREPKGNPTPTATIVERAEPQRTKSLWLFYMVEEGFEPSKTGVDRFTVCCR